VLSRLVEEEGPQLGVLLDNGPIGKPCRGGPKGVAWAKRIRLLFGSNLGQADLASAWNSWGLVRAGRRWRLGPLLKENKTKTRPRIDSAPLRNRTIVAIPDSISHVSHPPGETDEGTPNKMRPAVAEVPTNPHAG